MTSPPTSARPSAWMLGLRNAVVAVARLVGSNLYDARDGRKLGRALIVPWRGRIHLIGLEAETPVRLSFLTQERLTYWKQEIGFVAASQPDFPHEPAALADPRP